MTYTSDDLMRILESLTPGGSEFHNNPKACEEWVRGRLGTLSKVAGERNRLRAELETERELTNEFATKLALCQEELEQYKAAALLADLDVAEELEAHGLDIKGVPV